MVERTAHHIVEERLRPPGSYRTVRPGDRVYDLYGWSVGSVVEPRIVATRDEFFDGVVIDFRGRQVFVDAPEVRAVHEGVVVLGVTIADLADATRGHAVPPARPAGAAHSDDAVALMAAISRMYAADRLSLADLERDIERVLSARTCAEPDAIAAELLPAQAARDSPG